MCEITNYTEYLTSLVSRKELQIKMLNEELESYKKQVELLVERCVMMELDKLDEF